MKRIACKMELVNRDSGNWRKQPLSKCKTCIASLHPCLLVVRTSTGIGLGFALASASVVLFKNGSRGRGTSLDFEAAGASEFRPGAGGWLRLVAVGTHPCLSRVRGPIAAGKSGKAAVGCLVPQRINCLLTHLLSVFRSPCLLCPLTCLATSLTRNWPSQINNIPKHSIN
jgi:hypothetical protein